MCEPVFSTRISIKWESDPKPHEPTSTWVFTAGNEEFVDTRINMANSNPDWLITGYEKSLAIKAGYESTIMFCHDLDSLCKPGETPGADVGHFKSIEGSSDRLEEGAMMNPDLGKTLEYQEVWRTLDPIYSTVSELKPIAASTKQGESEVWKLENGKGVFIKIGRFAQGVAVNANNEYQCIRLFEKDVIYQYGNDSSQVFHPFIAGHFQQSSWVKTFQG